MNLYFDKNISTIKEKNPALHDELVEAYKHLNSENIKIIETKAGRVPEININNKKIYIHSRFDPVKEAERFAQEAEPANFDLVIIFGFGFAYHIEAFLNSIKEDANILVLEKDADIIAHAMANRDLTRILSDRRINIIAHPDEDMIAEIMRGKSSYKVSFVIHRGSFQLDPEYYNNLSRIAKSYLSTKDVNIATLAKFEKTWTANIARNIGRIISLPGANIFYDQFMDIPAIVVAAGPSLNQSIEFIKENAGKALIIAVDTSYYVLRRRGIVPHFCVTVDPQIVNARYFEGDSACATIVIADPTVQPCTFRLSKCRAAVTGMAFDTMKWIEDAAGAKGELTYGGSVTTNAYDFARRLGAKPVVLVAQDLAFTDGLAHGRGSYLDEQMHLLTSRFFTPEMFNRRQLTALPPVYVDGIQPGSRVHTNQKMIVFKQWFEKRNDPDLINAAYDGARLAGVKHIQLKDIKFNVQDIDVSAKINALYETSAVRSNEAVKDALLGKCGFMRKEVLRLLPALERAVNLSQDLVELAEKNKRDGKFDYIIKKLEEADKIIESMNALKDMIGMTIQRVIHTITEGYEIDEHDKQLSQEALVAKKSYYLYNGLLEGARFNLKVIDKMSVLLRK